MMVVFGDSFFVRQSPICCSSFTQFSVISHLSFISLIADFSRQSLLSAASLVVLVMSWSDELSVYVITGADGCIIGSFSANWLMK